MTNRSQPTSPKANPRRAPRVPESRQKPYGHDELRELLAGIQPPDDFKYPAMEMLSWRLEKILLAPVRAVDVLAVLFGAAPTDHWVAGGAGVLRQVALARGWQVVDRTYPAPRPSFLTQITVRYIAPPSWRAELRA